MAPSTASINLNKLNVKLDFPAPVLPTIPTFSLGLITNETPFKTNSSP